MIVVMGATGATGSALLHRLVTLGIPSRALSRDPERLWAGLDHAARRLVEARAADAGDPQSLRDAFQGASRLFLAMANSPEQPALEIRAIHAAAAVGIEHVVKLSAPAATADSPVAVSRWHHAIEETLRDSGLSHTVLRPYAFMQKLLTLAPAVAAQGVVHGAMGDAACNYVDCRDIADVAAEVLTRPELAGRTYTLTGSRTFSHPQLVELLGLLLGRPIRYVDLPPRVMRDQLIERAGLPAWLADHVVEIQRLAVTRPEEPTDTVASLLGRSPRTLEAFLGENIERFR
ncbi:NAD(P)H-binding protein (plasmid) [Embleya sp. NBC_00888]|uniref:NmrA family NAD(P)-binding protein n=1 Tax=Embleya sp. NBC_00888 TaxID=2975960 RepID=UPI002F918EF3|nr:NAD(P)H-binding protein [Embleya sp. NBC_00888]